MSMPELFLKTAVNELAVDVKYCGVRRYVHPPDHVSHMTLKDRRELAELLDKDCNSNLTSLSEQLGVGSVPVENEDVIPPGNSVTCCIHLNGSHPINLIPRVFLHSVPII